MDVGYSVKLEMDDEAKEDIDHYFSLYDICEIKLDPCDVFSSFFPEVINHINVHYQNKVSFHLPGDLLDNYLLYIDYIHTLNSVLKDFVGIFIIHVPIKNCFEKELSQLEKSKPSQATILFENDKDLSIRCFDKFFVANDAFSGCLDIGHAYLGCDDLSAEWSQINPCILAPKIKEFHIHNVVDGKDHLPFSSCPPALTIQIMKEISNCKRAILEMKKIDVYSEEAKRQYKMIKSL